MSAKDEAYCGFSPRIPMPDIPCARVFVEGREIQVPVGAPFEAVGKLWGVCNRCRQMVRLDKPFFGSFHFCGQRML